MASIEKLYELDFLYGFKFIEAYETLASDNITVSVFKLANDKNVAVDIIFINDEWHLSKPYAVDDEYIPLSKGAKNNEK